MYIVHVLNDASRSFDTAQEAVDYSARHVYLGYMERDAMVAHLLLGRDVSWRYGFSGVSIAPHRRAARDYVQAQTENRP